MSQAPFWTRLGASPRAVQSECVMHKVVILGIALWLMAAAVEDHAAVAQGADRTELLWTLPATKYVHYNVAAEKLLPPRRQLRVEDQQMPVARVYNGFFGHEISASGEFVKRIEPLLLDEALLQLAMFVPAGRQKPGATWQRDWAFTRLPELTAFNMSSTWEYKGREAYAEVMCYRVQGKHSLKLPEGAPQAGKRLRNFDIETTSWFDPALGGMRGALFAIHGVVAELPNADKSQDPIDYYGWQVEWRLARDFDSAEERILNGRVERAIALGVENLLASRMNGGFWVSARGQHVRGTSALALLALLMCDVPPEDKRIGESFKMMEQLPLDNIYDVSISVMALEARYISAEERRSFLDTDKPVQLKRDMTPEDRAEMQRLVDWICDNQNEPNPLWNYSRGHADNPARFDFSCTQYALLGLAAAQRCEIRIPPGVIRNLVDKVRDYQTANGPKMKRIVAYEPPKDPAKGKGRATYSTRTVEARGWAYASKPTWNKDTDITGAYGSMTASGVTCLMVGLECAASMSPEDFTKEFGNRSVYQTWEKAAQESIECGMAWLEYWFSVTRNPILRRTWYYYWMYGLERVGMLAGVKHFGEHNWYYQGCCPLLSLQQPGGSWGTVPDTAFALLFLKKGTVPPRRKVFTGEK